MRMEFKVTYEDGREVEAVAKPKDIAAFEAQYDMSVAVFADEARPPRMTWLYYLAWSPLHRQGREPRAFDEFLASVEDIEAKDEVPEAVPFETAPSAELLPS